MYNYDEPIRVELGQLVLVLALAVVAFAFLIGLFVTPYVHGQPLVLTRENLAVKNYLDAYGTRIATAEKDHAALAALLEPSHPSASGVFDLSQRARLAQSHLNDLARGVEATRVPGGLAALDTALRQALAAELLFADKTLTFVGRADEGSRTEALVAGEDAHTQLAAARQVLADTLR